MTPQPGGAVRPFEVTHRTVLRLAVPVTLAYLSVPLIGIVDTAVIGQLGDAALLGGVAIGAVIFSVVFTVFNFLRAGTTALTAQAFGAGDPPEMVAVLLRGLIIAVICGVAVLFIKAPLIAAGVYLMRPGPAVSAAVLDYLAVRMWASPLALINFVLMGWLLGLGRSTLVLVFQTLFALLNIALSIWFVLGLGWGVAGVAWSSVVAGIFVVFAQIPAVLRLAPSGRRPPAAVIFDRAGFVRVLAVNRDMVIRAFALLFVIGFFTRQGAQFGAVTLAANAVLMNFFTLGSYFLDGLAVAAEQLAGRSVGARYRPAFERAVSLSALWSLLTAVVVSLAYLLLGPLLIDLMVTAEDVRAAARAFLVWVVLTPLVGAIAFQMDGVFIGATWSRDMRNMMLLSLVLYLAVWAALTPFLGNHGLWIALLLFLGARGATLWSIMRRRIPETFPPMS